MSAVWATILGLGIGTFVIRFSFLGVLGGRTLPGWALRLLRYVPVAVMPALVAPLVAFPAATGGETDGARVVAACVALGVGAASRSALWSIGAGMAALYRGLWAGL